MTLTFDFSQAVDVPCDRCGWLDGRGNIQAVDDQRVSKTLCHQCVVDLVRVCLPDGRFAPSGTSTAQLPAKASA